MDRRIYLCHPDVFDRLRDTLRAQGHVVEQVGKMLHFGFIEILQDKNAPKHPRRWVFPRERLVEYGPEDEAWCRYFGIGEEIEDTTKILLTAVAIPEPAFRFVPSFTTPGRRPMFFGS